MNWSPYGPKAPSVENFSFHLETLLHRVEWLSNKASSLNPNMAYQHANHRDYHLRQSIWLTAVTQTRVCLVGFLNRASYWCLFVQSARPHKEFQPSNPLTKQDSNYPGR